MKKVLSLILALALAFAACVLPAAAKTVSSEGAHNVFFYVNDAQGSSVLLKVMSLSELKGLAHGQADGSNYMVSSTDNYPTTQYCEGVGFTVGELLDYVKSVTAVKGASELAFSGGDTLRLMATDSYGNYSRSWTWDQLYGVERYYFEGMYDADTGWKTGWEVAGEDSSKFGVTLDEYNVKYRATDPYYADKRAVFAGGKKADVVLMTQSYSGRTTGETLVASTEPGIAAYIAKNGGAAAGCLADAVTDEYALRLSLPMTEADLMAAHRTAYDNFKWIYNLKLDREAAPNIRSLGTVAECVPTFSLSGNTLTVKFTCATQGADIYYGWDGAPQTLYTGPVTVDVTGRDLSAQPVTVYATAVKEGYDDAGVLTFKYPGMAPSFKTVYSGMTGSKLVFSASEGVTSACWTAWTGAMNFISMKAPSAGGYVTLDSGKYTMSGAEKTITFDKSLFTETGSYSFIFHAAKYANKSVSVVMKKAAPKVSTAESYVYGGGVTLTFADTDYQKAISVYVTGEDGVRTMISSSCLDRTQSGQVSIKPEYFSLSSSAVKSAGTYTLELTNNNYTPSAQTVTIMLKTGFSDVSADAWYFAYVTELADSGVIDGVGGGKFEPDGTLTWGQAMKLLMLTVGYEQQPATGTHWASGYMDRAAADGLIVSGMDPDAALARLEFCRTAAKALKAGTTLAASPFTDTDDPDVLALCELGVIDGMGGGLFSPDTTLTRAQISKIIWCIRNLEVNQ